METNVYVTLQPPSSATTIFHRSFTLITIPSGIGTEHFNNFELIVIITPESNINAQRVTITRSHLLHTIFPVSHRTGNIVLRSWDIILRSIPSAFILTSSILCSRNEVRFSSSPCKVVCLISSVIENNVYISCREGI